MAIANELSGEVAVAVLAKASNEEQQDKTRLKEILVNFYSALRPLNIASRQRQLHSKAASASTSPDQPLLDQK